MIPVGFPERSFVAKFPSVADELRLDQLDLAEEVALAGLDLVGHEGRGSRAGGT